MIKLRKMETKFYILTRIDGEYAYLSDKESKEELFIAMALLPHSADIGSELKYENMEFTLIEN